MSSRLVLLGGGGHASDVLAAIEMSSDPPTAVLIADDAQVATRRFTGRAEVLSGTIDDAFTLDALFLTAVGYPATREKIAVRADRAAVSWASAMVHGDATVHPTVELGLDSVIMGQTWLSPHVVLGDHANVGYGVTIGHDTVAGSFAAIMPGASIGGDVVLGDLVMVGANASVLQGIRIGTGAVVGAGAVVTSDVPAGVVVVGVPARPLG